jgi:hypothetical protein
LEGEASDMDEVTKLRKENEKLKQQIQKGRDFMRFNEKTTDLIFLIIVSVAYFSSVHFLVGLSIYGIESSFETMSPEFAIFCYLSSIMILYISGLFYALSTLFNIFEDDIERFVVWLKVTLFPGKKSKKSPKTKSPSQTRTPDGKFAPKNG